MTKRLRTVKASIVMGILLVSLFVAFIPSTSAAPLLFGCDADVKMNYDAIAASNKVVPLSGEITIPINISTQVQGLFANILVPMLFNRGVTTSVDLSIKNSPSWATARVSPNVVNPDISTSWTGEEAYVHVSFNVDSPAHATALFTIEMHVRVPGAFGRVREVTKTAEISFVPSYLPIIDATPQSTYKEISPGEILTFNIDLENLGNAETEFLFSVIDVPDGWSASIISNTKVGSRVDGNDPTRTIQLFVQPPYGFGYHNEREDIKISVRGRYFAGGAGVLETEDYEIIFTVRNRGFSTPGFEAAFTLFALVGIALIVKKRKKN